MTVIFRISHASEPALHARSAHGCPMVIGDTMPETQHMADGQYYTSKRRFRDVTRAHGCVEVGNDPSMFRPRPEPKPDRKAIKASIGKAFARAGFSD